MPRNYRTEFVEADFEIAFNLLDIAETQSLLGDRAGADRVIHDAEEVFVDIKERLHRLGTFENQAFGPLVTELQRELDLAHTHVHH
jgi:hypothetical protein